MAQLGHDCWLRQDAGAWMREVDQVAGAEASGRLETVVRKDLELRKREVRREERAQEAVPALHDVGTEAVELARHRGGDVWRKPWVDRLVLGLRFEPLHLQPLPMEEGNRLCRPRTREQALDLPPDLAGVRERAVFRAGEELCVGHRVPKEIAEARSEREGV